VLYYFDESLRRYRRTNGRYVSDAEIESIAKKLEDESFATLDKSLADLKSEKIKLRQWA
jgi:predicted nucleic acid-binding protein